TLTSSNAAAKVPASVTVPAGQGFAAFTVTTSTVAADTPVTITGKYGVSQSATITVLATPGGGGGTAAAVDIALSGVPASIRRGQTFTATATVTNSGTATASGYSVVVSLTPSGAMRLQSPTSSTQSVAALAPSGSKGVSWQIRGNNTASATVTMTLRDPSGATVKTVSSAIRITN